MRIRASKDNLSDFSKQKSKSSSHIIIDGKFCVKSLKAKYSCYNFYKGIDISRAKWVHIYIKQSQSQTIFPLSKSIKEHLRNQLSPKVIWRGNLQIQKYNYFMEVHEKFGPSLQNVFDRINRLPNQRQLLHLLLEMVLIKIFRLSKSKKCIAQDMSVDNQTPTLLFLIQILIKLSFTFLTALRLKKRIMKQSQFSQNIVQEGPHLGRSIGVKDDLESICYILIDLFSGGKFLQNKMPFEYLEQKLSLKIQEFAQCLPMLFIDFYNYAINLNCSDDINFYYWKAYLAKVLTPDVVSQPYGFLVVKNGGERHMTTITKGKESQQEQDSILDKMEFCEDNERQFNKHIEKVFREIPNILRSKVKQV